MTDEDRAALAAREYQLAVVNGAPKEKTDELLSAALDLKRYSTMNKQAYIVVFAGLYPAKRVPVSVMATDKNDARCAAIEHAKKEGQALADRLRVVLA